MQKVVAYRLERRDGMQWAEGRTAAVAKVKELVRQWLVRKEGSGNADSGTYVTETGGKGGFEIEEARDGSRGWWLARLDEADEDGRRVTATLSVTTLDDLVVVYATVEVGTSTTEINRVDADARCPKVIRSILKSPGPWYHGSSRLRLRQQVRGFEAGEQLALEIAASERTVPIVAVTEQDGGGVVLPHLDDKLAYDLTGLANVVVLDAEASWALTDHLGHWFTCYGGAVRLYWPSLTPEDDPYRHPLWTTHRLLSSGENPLDVRERFRNQIRRMVMKASALGVVRPRAIDEIRSAAARRAFAEMAAASRSIHDYRALAESYADDNEKLRSIAANGERRIEDLEFTILRLEDERRALLARVENAELQLRYRESEKTDIRPDTGSEVTSQEPGAPSVGEIRFYKKLYAAQKHDVLTRVADCGCNNWEGAHAADKARKGIEKLEGRSDWKSLLHCASCTGGGMWKVRW